ncbi:MAG TPA: PTS system mannose/fructose/sorbose family transporter subunit IID [Candidatus Dormibacteraeota bacterium]|nr:PTS system mannose/fructose/sorbose family transporter subunit IID [Candidatus Dormibacteraeota bacterium]
MTEFEPLPASALPPITPPPGPPAPAAIPRVRGRDLMRVESRALYIQALFSAERQQGPGFAFALLPVLRRVYTTAGERGRALARHMGFFGTHPVLSGIVLGVVARLEERRAQGLPVDEAQIETTKRALASPLAALGDPLFWVTLRPLAGLMGVLGMAVLPLADTVGPDLRVVVCPSLALLTYNAVAIRYRVAGVPRGYAMADDPGGLLRSLHLPELRRFFERVSAFAFGALVTLTLWPMAQSADPGHEGFAHKASVLAPFVLGSILTAILLRRWPGRTVEIAFAAALVALVLSTRI